MDLLSNLTIGIISGLISTVLIWLIVIVFKNLINPRIKELLYRGIDLEGEWHAESFITKEINNGGIIQKKKEKVRELTLTINQNAYQLKGDIIIKNIFDNGQEDKFSFYKYNGFIKDNYIILTYLPKSKKCIGLGSLLLIVKEGGMNLKGDLCGTALGDMNISHINELDFIRKL